MKKLVNTNIIVGAGALSIKKLMQSPIKLEAQVTRTEINIINSNLFVNKNAIEPGAIIRPIDSIIPTADKVATIVKEIMASKL